MSEQDPGFKLAAPFFGPADGTTKAETKVDEASRAADTFAKFLLPASDETALSSDEAAPASVRGRKTVAVRLKITARRGSRLPSVRLHRRSKGFVNIPLLRSVVVASAATAAQRQGRIGE